MAFEQPLIEGANGWGNDLEPWAMGWICHVLSSWKKGWVESPCLEFVANPTLEFPIDFLSVKTFKVCRKVEENIGTERRKI